MSAKNYKPSLSLVLAHEGGYVNHPKDPGGPTNKGVTQRVYDAYRKLHGLAVQSVKLIAADELAELYKKQYWCLVRGDDMPAGLDYAVFDFAVNSGVSRAIRYLQRTVGVNDDAVIGDMTLGAVIAEARKDELGLINRYCANRMAFLRSLGTFPTFGTGWTRRVVGYTPGAQEKDTGVLDYATVMAQRDVAFGAGSAATLPLPAEIGSKPGEVPGKAISDDYDNWPMATQNDYLAGWIGQS
jgi:hypothetical protein